MIDAGVPHFIPCGELPYVADHTCGNKYDCGIRRFEFAMDFEAGSKRIRDERICGERITGTKHTCGDESACLERRSKFSTTDLAVRRVEEAIICSERACGTKHTCSYDDELACGEQRFWRRSNFGPKMALDSELRKRLAAVEEELRFLKKSHCAGSGQ